MPESRRESFYRDHLHEGGGQCPEFDPQSVQIAVNLALTYDLLQNQLSRAAATHGLSKSTLNVLLILRHGPPSGMQLHDLGELLLVSRANVTGLIDHLESKGMVKRMVDPNDRRARIARITRKGEILLDQYMPTHYRQIRTLLQNLSSQEKVTFLSLLRKSRDSIAAGTEGSEAEDKVA